MRRDRLIDTVAWVLTVDGRILCARSRGKDVFYIPGGKREPGESSLDALLREVKEELTVDLVPETVRHIGTYEAQAHAQADGVRVRMSCYTARHHGTPMASSEIEELDWLGYGDIDRVAPVDQLLFNDLRADGWLLRPADHRLSRAIDVGPAGGHNHAVGLSVEAGKLGG